MKQKSINDVKSMSLFGTCDVVPESFIICIINSTFMSNYVDDFINNTQTFQINDARQIPIIIPTSVQITELSQLFTEAVSIKKTDNDSNKLYNLQTRLDEKIKQLYLL